MSQNTSPFRSDVLAGKRILITGGGTGLGRGVARHLAEHGAHVHLWGRREAVLEEARDHAVHNAPGAGALPDSRRQGLRRSRGCGRRDLGGARAADRGDQQRSSQFHRTDEGPQLRTDSTPSRPQ